MADCTLLVMYLYVYVYNCVYMRTSTDSLRSTTCIATFQQMSVPETPVRGILCMSGCTCLPCPKRASCRRDGLVAATQSRVSNFTSRTRQGEAWGVVRRLSDGGMSDGSPA